MKIIPCLFFKKDATKETMTTTFMLVQVHVDYHLKIDSKLNEFAVYLH